MKIAIVGIGYVGLANAIMLDQLHNVVLVDVDESKVKKINQRKSPISDSMIDDYLINVSKDFAATKNFEKAYKSRELIIIATPTNYDVDNDSFDTSSI
ncbi:MAG: UDP-glucose 6-dehydrogenase, partial [Nitrosomonadales bacterium]|nr:UDP-glucose 6-dehydrogenase [Nitrosomonadales bacterium]